MSQIGPQIPSHLVKRKRSIDDGSGDDDGQDDVGRCRRRASPKSPLGPTSPRRVAGPASMPPPVARNEDEIVLDGEEEEDKNGGHDSGPAVRPTMGPTMPLPADSSNNNNNDDGDDDDDDDDDDYGPALPTGNETMTDSHRHDDGNDNDTTADDDLYLHGRRRPPSVSTDTGPAQRDEWMLAPPTADDTGLRASDPTKIRARKFATGRAAAASSANFAAGGAAASAIGSLWTETTEQKARRLADTVLGRAPDPRHAGGGGGGGGSAAAAAAAARQPHTSSSSAHRSRKADEAQIKAYTESTRGRSLYEEHQEALKQGKPREERKDRERDRERDRDRDRERDRESRHRHGDRHRDRDHKDRDSRDRHRDDRHDSRHKHRHQDSDRHDRHSKHSRKEGRREEGRSDRHDGHDRHNHRPQAEEEDDPSARAFDREKDMGLAVHINHKQRRELLQRAGDFGGRFQKGSYL